MADEFKPVGWSLAPIEICCYLTSRRDSPTMQKCIQWQGRHIYFPYIPNVSTKPEPIDSKTVAHNRGVRQEQRYNERQIRNWKRQNAVNPTDRNKAKIGEWQGRQRDLIKSEPQIARQYEREQI